MLVDEYDKPILNVLNSPEAALRHRSTLQGFYSTIKKEDKRIRFCFVTGLTRFTHVSLFSGANNLTDITLEPTYSEICGYTQSELDAVFAEELTGVDQEEIRNWYNGYSWRGNEKVYNPYTVLQLLRKGEFGAWWYESSTPTFLHDALKGRKLLPSAWEKSEITVRDLDAFEIENISTEALLFQTGYLAIMKESKTGGILKYHLGYPNREVRQSLTETMLGNLIPGLYVSLGECTSNLPRIIQGGAIDELHDTLKSAFAGIPYNWHTTSLVANYEAYFASVVYGICVGAELDGSSLQSAG